MTQVQDETEADFGCLMNADFGAPIVGKSYQSRLIDWVHFRARIIPQRPRKIVWSPNTQGNISKYPALEKIAEALECGADIAPWLSTSVVRKKSDPKADLMFNDWQIIHFHLGNVFVKPTQISRTKALLFVYISRDRAVFLDVQPHGAWSMLDLLRILLHVSPRDMEQAEMLGVVGLQYNPSEKDIFKLRKNGVTATFELDGRFFISPGFGVSSSGHATRLVRYVQQMSRAIRALKQAIEKNQLPRHLQQNIFASIGIPVRLGVRFEGTDFCFYDKNRRLDLMFMPSPE